MTSFKRPMLAAKLMPSGMDTTNENILARMKLLRYPVRATLKLDGIRAEKTNDLFSRTLKLIPNISIRTRAMKIPRGFDMELFNPELSFDEIESIVMSEEHEDSDKIEFHLLDLWNVDRPYDARLYEIALHFEDDLLPKDCVKGAAPLIHSAEKLLEFFLKCEQEQGEGICFRTPDSPYKQGRSTLKEQYLVKLCRTVRQEVTVIGFEEQQMNINPTKRNAVGMMDRRKTLDGKFGKNTLGKFLVRDKNGLEFKVGTGVGLTDVRRQEIWDNRDCWYNKTITIQHKPHGQKIKPRSPIYIGERRDI